MRLIALLFSLLVYASTFAQTESEVEYVPESRFENKNQTYEDDIHSMSLTRMGNTSTLPYIRLRGNERLTLRFDDFSNRQDDINYRIVHCESNWETSNIPFRYYARGIEEGFLLNYQYSRTLNQSFVSYSLEIPNDDIQLTQSGNYVIYIYRNGKINKPILSHRFYVTEDQVEIEMDIHRAFDPMYRDKKQELDFSISHEKYPIINPDQSLKVVLLQNQRWDNAITDLKPLFIEGSKLTYNYDGENTFWAGNEYRYFDIRNTNIRSENVDGFVKRIDTTHIFLDKAEPKKSHNAMDGPNNLYGGYQIGSSMGFDNTFTDTDYAQVYFYINAEYENPNGKYYAFGGFTNFEHNEKYRYTYNEEKKRYELQVYLKQGLYNWHHHFVRNGNHVGELKQMEGNYAITNNQYTLLVYHRPFGQDFDRLIKVAVYTFPNPSSENND